MDIQRWNLIKKELLKFDNYKIFILDIIRELENNLYITDEEFLIGPKKKRTLKKTKKQRKGD